jgi:hypothetical protein
VEQVHCLLDGWHDWPTDRRIAWIGCEVVVGEWAIHRIVVLEQLALPIEGARQRRELSPALVRDRGQAEQVLRRYERPARHVNVDRSAGREAVGAAAEPSTVGGGDQSPGPVERLEYQHILDLLVLRQGDGAIEVHRRDDTADPFVVPLLGSVPRIVEFHIGRGDVDVSSRVVSRANAGDQSAAGRPGIGVCRR